MNDTSEPSPQQVDAWLEQQPPGEGAGPGAEAGTGLSPSSTGTGWPTVIGIIAIVFGAGGILGGVLGMLGPAINRVMINVMPADQVAGIEAQAKYQWWAAGLSVLATLIALWLLLGGIGLLKKRPAAAGKIKAWAKVKIAFVLLMVGVQALIQTDVFSATQTQTGGGFSMPEGFVLVMVGLTVIFMLLWGLALPVFMLIWFGRKSIKNDVEKWEPA